MVVFDEGALLSGVVLQRGGWSVMNDGHWWWWSLMRVLFCQGWSFNREGGLSRGVVIRAAVFNEGALLTRMVFQKRGRSPMRGSHS